MIRPCHFYTEDRFAKRNQSVIIEGFARVIATEDSFAKRKQTVIIEGFDF
jgi:hypothetical protein